MKIRYGFISNSSSTAYFICQICGKGGTSNAWEPEAWNMVICTNKHMFCKHHLLKISNEKIKEIEDNILDYFPAAKKILDQSDDKEKILREFLTTDFPLEKLGGEYEEYYRDYDYDLNENIPEYLCPICSLNIIHTKESYNIFLNF